MRPRHPRALRYLVAGLLAAWALLGSATARALPARGKEPCTVAVNPPSPVSVSIPATALGRVGPGFSWTATFTCSKKAFPPGQWQTYIWADLSAAAVADPTYGLLFPVTSTNGKTIDNLFIRLASVAPANRLDPSGESFLMAIRQDATGSGTGTLKLRGRFVVTKPLHSGPALQVSPLTFINAFSNGASRNNTSPPYGQIALPAGFTIIPPSCTVSNPVVSLPPVVKSVLAGAGLTTGKTPFSVDLTGCTEGTELTIGLSGASALADPAKGVVAQAPASSTADEVGVQVLYGSNPGGPAPDTPVDIGGDSFTSFTWNGDTLTIAYSAQYYALKPVTRAGEVSVVLTYTLAYP